MEIYTQPQEKQLRTASPIEPIQASRLFLLLHLHLLHEVSAGYGIPRREPTTLSAAAVAAKASSSSSSVSSSPSRGSLLLITTLPYPGYIYLKSLATERGVPLSPPSSASRIACHPCPRDPTPRATSSSSSSVFGHPACTCTAQEEEEYK